MKGPATALVIASISSIASIVAFQAPPDPFPMRALDIPYEAGSPDGAFAVYHKDNVATRLYVRDVKTGAERVLVEADGPVTSPTWSTDSRQVAFTVTNPTTRALELRVVAADSGEVRTVKGATSSGRWTTRNELVFQKPNPAIGGVDWMIVPADGSAAPKRFYAQNYDSVVAIAPDASSVILSQRGELVLDEVASGSQRPVAGGVGQEAGPLFSPDGKLIAFSSDRDGRWALYVAPVDKLPASHPVKVANFDGPPQRQNVWWTRDGRLAIRATYDDDAVYRVEMDATGHAKAPAAALKQDTAVVHDFVTRSRDGRRVAYEYVKGLKVGIGVAAGDGGGERRFLEGDRISQAGGVQPLAWRSANELLIYDAIRSPKGLYALDADSGAVRLVAPLDLGDADSAYVSARQELVYSTGTALDDAGQLKARSLADGKERTIATISFLMSFAVSADGKHIAYTRWTARPIAANVTAELNLMSIDGKPEKTLLPANTVYSLPASFSPDGKSLLYYLRGATPRVISIEDGQSWPLFEQAGPLAFRSVNVSWSSDGVLLMPGHQPRTEAQARAWDGVTYEAVSRLIAGR